ncbi:hypothetical protein HMPREF1246_0799 [Acidaminococcus sp. BV3L6]|nr:hypothetical protein HMPREF1246_0799 [Acidaminococcus sp. BV3L6]
MVSPRPVIHKVFSMVPPLPRFFSLASSPIMTEAEQKFNIVRIIG